MYNMTCYDYHSNEREEMSVLNIKEYVQCAR